MGDADKKAPSSVQPKSDRDEILLGAIGDELMRLNMLLAPLISAMPALREAIAKDAKEGKQAAALIKADILIDQLVVALNASCKSACIISAMTNGN